MNVSLWLSVGVALLMAAHFLNDKQRKWLRYACAVVGVALLIQPVIAGLHWLGGLVGV
jgi:hypothetical protein